MFPKHYLSLFPPFPRNDTVFVAMPFDGDFTERWINVIKPGIETVSFNGRALAAHRVDTRYIGDSILTEILGGISNSRLVFADVSTIGHIGQKAVRNSNVMYELGIAHASRLPEEILVFRSDEDALMFDLANIRVNSYTPNSDPGGSIERIVKAVNDALSEIDLKKSLSVKMAAGSLDGACFERLLQISIAGESKHHTPKTMREHMGFRPWKEAIDRLLEVGAISMSFSGVTKELLKAEIHDGSAASFARYTLTPFGKAVLQCLGSDLLAQTDPDVIVDLQRDAKKAI